MDSGRKWWPEEYVDEVVPRCEHAPSDWIVERGGKLILRGADPEGDGESERELVEGETVDFLWSEDRGSIEVMINADGSHSLAGPDPNQDDLFDGLPPTRVLPIPERMAIPSDVTHFWEEGDSDTIADSLDQFCRNYAENAKAIDGGAQEFPLRVTVAMYTWSEPIKHRLVLVDGKPRFEPVAANSVQ